jgi:hypothetical protein
MADWDALFAEQLPHVYNFFRYRVGLPHGRYFHGLAASGEHLTACRFA